MPREVRIGSELIGGTRVPVIAGDAGGGDLIRRGPQAPGRRDHPAPAVPAVVDVEGPVDPHSPPGGDAVLVNPFVAGEAEAELAELGLPVLLRRAAGADTASWLAAARSLEEAGIADLALCEGGDLGAAPDLTMLAHVQARSDLPVIVDVGAAPGLAGAAVAAGADSLLLASHASRDEAARAVKLAATLPALSGQQREPQTLAAAREAIDQVDAGLANLLERRTVLVSQIQRLKPVGGFAGRDLARERELVATMASRAPRLGLDRLQQIMAVVIQAGLELAEAEAPGEGRAVPAGPAASSPPPESLRDVKGSGAERAS